MHMLMLDMCTKTFPRVQHTVINEHLIFHFRSDYLFMLANNLLCSIASTLCNNLPLLAS